MDNESTEQDIELGRSAQVQVADLVLGIMSIKPSDDDPAVRLGVRNMQTGETEQLVLVPGTARSLLGHTLEVVSINREAPESVVLRVERDEESA